MVDFYSNPGNSVPEQGESNGTEKAHSSAGSYTLNGAELGGVALIPDDLREAVKLVIDTIVECPEGEDGFTIAKQRVFYRDRLGDAPIPKEVIDTVLRQTPDSFTYGAALDSLSRGRGAEMLPWVEDALQSEDHVIFGFAMMSLLYIDEARGIQEIERRFEPMYRTYMADRRQYHWSPGWLYDVLLEIGSPAYLAAADRIAKLSKQIRNEFGEEY